MKNLTTLIAVAAFATSICTIAQADSTAGFHVATVKFADLDIANTSGAAALYQRLQAAAKNVCRDLEPGRSLALITPYANCMQSALSNAVAHVDRPAVTAYAAGRGVVPSASAIKIARNN